MITATSVEEGTEMIDNENTAQSDTGEWVTVYWVEGTVISGKAMIKSKALDEPISEVVPWKLLGIKSQCHKFGDTW